MITKQCSPLQTIKCLSSSFALRAAVNKLAPFLFPFGDFLKVSMYFDLQGDHTRLMSHPFVRQCQKQDKAGPRSEGTQPCSDCMHTRAPSARIQASCSF